MKLQTSPCTKLRLSWVIGRSGEFPPKSCEESKSGKHAFYTSGEFATVTLQQKSIRHVDLRAHAPNFMPRASQRRLVEFYVMLITSQLSFESYLVKSCRLVSIMAEYNKYVSTTGGKVTFKLSHNGYTYSKRKTIKGTEYYYCDQRKICSASVIYRRGTWTPGRGSSWTGDKAHQTHAPNYDRAVAQEAVGKAKELAKTNPDMSTSEIMAQSVDRLSLESHVTLRHDDYIRRMINRHKVNDARFPDPKLLAELILPPHFETTLRGEKFLSFDSEDHNKVMIFNTAANAEVRRTYIIISLTHVLSKMCNLLHRT